MNERKANVPRIKKKSIEVLINEIIYVNEIHYWIQQIVQKYIIDIWIIRVCLRLYFMVIARLISMFWLTLGVARPQGSSRSHCERMNTSSRPMKSMNALPPQVDANVGPVGTLTRQSQRPVDIFTACCCYRQLAFFIFDFVLA